MAKKERYMKTIRRTREQVKRDAELYSHCAGCKVLLKHVAIPRSSAKRCPSCRGDMQQNSTGMREVFTDFQKNPIPEEETEIGEGLQFTDNPLAEKRDELETGKVVTLPTVTTYGVSEIWSTMSAGNSNHTIYNKKEPKRSSYRKGKIY